MDSVEPTTSATPTPPTSTPQPTTDPTPSPPPPTQPQSQPPPQTLPPPSPELPQNPNPNPTQNPTTPPPQPQSSTPLPTSQHSQTPTPTPTPRPHPPLTRPRPPQSYPQYAQPHLTTSSSSTPLPSPSTTSTPLPRAGGLALGVPAHQPRPSQPTSFSSFGPSSYSQQFVGLGRNPVSVGDSSANQVKQPITGVQTTIGSMGSLSFGAQSRQPAALQQQQRAVHPSMRPQATPSNQSMPNQRPGLSRAQSLGSPSPGTPIGLQQPWGPSGPQGKQMQPPLPSSSGRQQKPQSLQQRSHLPPQHPHSLPTSSHPQMASAQQQQQSSQMHQSQEHFGQQQYPPPRAQQLNQQQQQAPRGPGSGPGNQKTPAVATGQSGMIQSGTASLDAGESGKNIVGKRCIHELVSQVDPTEKLDPEVEDILIEMAEDFVDSITTFGCSLAKHRKSVTLEAKDILLHLERNWHMALPGFGGDEIKSFKKQCTTDIHKERLAAVKKSVVGLDAANTKSFAGQTPGNAKGHAAKAPPAPGSPKGA